MLDNLKSKLAIQLDKMKIEQGHMISKLSRINKVESNIISKIREVNRAQRKLMATAPERSWFNPFKKGDRVEILCVYIVFEKGMIGTVIILGEHLITIHVNRSNLYSTRWRYWRSIISIPEETKWKYPSLILVKILTTVAALYITRGLRGYNIAAENQFNTMKEDSYIILLRAILNVTSEDEH